MENKSEPSNIRDSGQERMEDKYFAVRPPKELASACLAKSKSFYNTLEANFFLDKLARCWQFYHGEYGDNFTGASHMTGFTGEEGELVVLPVNHFRNIAQHILVMITSSRPSMEARAVNTDYKSLSQTYLANGILDYYMREKKLEGAIYRATEMAVVMGAGYVRLEWNATAGELYDFDPDTGEKNYEGELEFTVHSPFDVVFDGTKETWNNEWIIVRTFVNKYNLMAKYPEYANKINAIPTKQISTTNRIAVFSNDSTDDIPVYEFFHKRTEAVPEGRYCMFADNDVILLDLPLPYREIPIYRITSGEFIGTPYGYSPMFDLYPLQEAANAMYSGIMTNNSAFMVQNLFVPRGADIEINSLEGAMNIIEGNAKPEPLQLTASSQETYKFLEMIIQGMETLSAVNSVARGDPQASLKSGAALALVQSMALQFMSGLQNNYVKFIEDIGTSLINILKDYAKTPKTVALVGKQNRTFLKEFVGDDIHQINRIIVSMGNPMAKTTAGRVQMAEQMLQMGLIKNPKEYFEVLNTGSIETMYESDMNEMLLIKRENETLMEGKPVIADLLDTHALHIMEHRNVMADPELRFDVNLRQAVQAHIQEHINFLRTVDKDLLMLTGQQPLQSPPEAALNLPPNGLPPPPPMPPGGPMGGPPGMPPGPPMPPQGGPQPPHGAHGRASQMMQQQGPPQPGQPGMPSMPTPPGEFANLPTNPQDMLPQG